MDSDDEVPELISHEAPPPSDLVPQPPVKVPLTIITGFLGSGKSTFLKYVLTEKHGYRIAIIMNEFGDTADIEGRAISVSSPDDPSSLATEFLELANGCLCCSIKDTGVASIEKLMRKQGAFDYIMLETTGLADPGPIAATFWQNEDFSEQIILDGVVCVVDGVFGLKELDSENRTASRQQIALADVTLLNKVDLAEDAKVLALEREIRHINPTTPIIRTTHGKVDLARVLNTGAYNSFKLNQLDHVHDAECDHQHDLESISSVQVQLPTLTEMQISKLDEWIRSVLWEGKLAGAPDGQTLEVLRCKGIYSSTTGKSHLLQGVQTLYDVTELSSSEGAGGGKIVLIGRGLSSSITDHLEQYLGFSSTNV